MSPLWFLLALFGGTFVFWLLFYILFHFRSTDAIIKAHEKDKDDIYMKKYPEVDVYKYHNVFLRAGLVITLLFLFLAFNWTVVEKSVVDMGQVVVPHEIEQLPPPSQQKPPPPPPPPPPPTLDVVSDEVEILEDEPDIFDMEAAEETMVEMPDELPEIKEEVVEEVVEIEKVVEKEEEPEEPEIFIIVEDMPQYPGGQKALFQFINSIIQYPQAARENGIGGTVYVGFVILEDGSIGNVHIKRGLVGGGAGCNDEAMRVVKALPNWIPGKQRGKAVRVAYTLPVKFLLK